MVKLSGPDWVTRLIVVDLNIYNFNSQHLQAENILLNNKISPEGGLGYWQLLLRKELIRDFPLTEDF